MSFINRKYSLCVKASGYTRGKNIQLHVYPWGQVPCIEKDSGGFARPKGYPRKMEGSSLPAPWIPCVSFVGVCTDPLIRFEFGFANSGPWRINSPRFARGPIRFANLRIRESGHSPHWLALERINGYNIHSFKDRDMKFGMLVVPDALLRHGKFEPHGTLRWFLGNF